MRIWAEISRRRTIDNATHFFGNALLIGRNDITQTGGPVGAAAGTVILCASRLGNRTQHFAAIAENDAQFLQVVIRSARTCKSNQCGFRQNAARTPTCQVFRAILQLAASRPPTDFVVLDRPDRKSAIRANSVYAQLGIWTSGCF
jgi:hypothetical protein